MKARQPFNYKLLDLGLSGKVAGSAQPGGAFLSTDPGIINSIIERLSQGKTPEEAKVPPRLMAELNFLNNNNIQTIYNLVDPHNPLIKYVWENIFHKTYITELNGVSTAITNFKSPSQEQLQLITNDAATRLNNGENILVHCEGGRGRTGTILGAIYMKATKDYNYRNAVDYVRNNYAKDAIESPAQTMSLLIFAEVQKQIEKSAQPVKKKSFAEQIISPTEQALFAEVEQASAKNKSFSAKATARNDQEPGGTKRGF